MSAADGLPRKEEDGSAILSTLTISGRQADISWLRLSRKQDRLKTEVGALPTPSANLAVRQHLTLNERKSHEARYPLPKPVALSQELQTKSNPPNPPGREIEFRFSPGALRFETANQNV